MTKRSKVASWSPVMLDERLKVAIRHRMRENGWNLKKLSEESGITYSRLSRYFNNNPGGITHMQLYFLCDMLKIKVSLKVELQ